MGWIAHKPNAKVFDGPIKTHNPLMGGYPTNKNYDSDIFKKQSTPKLLRDKHTKLTFMHVATMIMFFKRKNYRGE